MVTSPRAKPRRIAPETTARDAGRRESFLAARPHELLTYRTRQRGHQRRHRQPEHFGTQHRTPRDERRPDQALVAAWRLVATGMFGTLQQFDDARSLRPELAY